MTELEKEITELEKEMKELEKEIQKKVDDPSSIADNYN